MALDPGFDSIADGESGALIPFVVVDQPALTAVYFYQRYIARRHCCSLRAQSRPGGGTAMCLRLPLALQPIRTATLSPH